MRRVTLGWVAAVLLATEPQAARAQTDSTPGHWAVLTGMGESHPGWGATTERVKTVDLTLRYAGLINRPLGPDWLHMREQLWIELPVLYAYEPDDGPLFCMNFLFCGLYENYETVQPYVTIGGGPVYATTDIPGMGSHLCGNYQAGLGLRLPLGTWSLRLEGRYHHISNLGFADPNVPINSLRCLVGVSREF